MEQATRRIGSTIGDGALPIACNLGNSGLVARADLVRNELLAGVEERRELDTGFAFRFLSDGDWTSKIYEFVAAERRCCSFFRIEVTFEPGLGLVWLTLTGPDGTRQFIEHTFVSPS